MLSADIQNKFSMMDCLDLVTNELYLPFEASDAIKFIDSNYNNAWSKHLDDVEKQINDPRYVRDKNFVIDVSTNHYNTLREFIRKYKAESGGVEKEFDSFFKE